jgi:hypothetical protein
VGVVIAGVHTSRHRKVTVQRSLLAGKTKTRRLAPQHLDMVGHVVVKSEVAYRDKVQPGFFLHSPMLFAQAGSRGFQRSQADLAAPVFFEREFQFPVRAHARKTQGMYVDHVSYLPMQITEERMVGQIQLLFKRKILPFNMKIIDSLIDLLIDLQGRTDEPVHP